MQGFTWSLFRLFAVTRLLKRKNIVSLSIQLFSTV